MAYFPSDLKKCVVFLGFKDVANQKQFAGSAFWISRPGPEDIKSEYRPAYLVTAAHVIDDIEKKCAPNDKSVLIRVNETKGNQDWRETPLRFWKRHPEYPSVDIAVLKVQLDTSMDHVAWPTEAIADKGNLDKDSDRNLELGDEVFFSGLFYPHTGTLRNIPIVRIGNIAALREEPVLSRNGKPMDLYLMESRSIGGLSGSPVFVDLAALKRSHQPTGGLMAAGSEMMPVSGRFKLIGVVHGHFDWEDNPNDSLDSSSNQLGVNMGIAMVIPSEKILENLEVFVDEENKEAEEVRKKEEGGTAISK